MEVNLHSTSKIVELVINGVAVPARVWEGETALGIPCHAYITRIAVEQEEDTNEFERDLQEHASPTADIQAIPLRLVL